MVWIPRHRGIRTPGCFAQSRSRSRCYTSLSPILGACRSSIPMSQPVTPTPRTRLVREADRAVYDREAAYRILDEGFLCHAGFVVEGQPFVIPTSYGRKKKRDFFYFFFVCSHFF